MASKDLGIALITGAGSGVGRATSVALAEAGFSLVLAGRREEALAETSRLLSQEPLIVPTDVSMPESVDSLYARIEDRFGRLDVLFNNAGVTAPAVPLEDLSYEDWSKVVSINFTGAFLCLQGAFRLMKKQTPRGGRIINNGSVSAHMPRPLSAPYTATKTAITGLTRSALLDGRPYDIACGQIDIGNAATDMTAKMAEGVLQADGQLAPEPCIPVEDVASAVVYMAQLPLKANVPFMTVMATKMPYIGRG